MAWRGVRAMMGLSKRLTNGLIVIGAAIASVIILYLLAYPPFSYRYRLTVEVDTPDGVRSGSSVIQVRGIKYPRFIGTQDTTWFVSGEAVFVDLGNGKNLIAVLADGPSGAELNNPRWVIAHQDYPKWIALLAFADLSKGRRPQIPLESDMSNLRGRSDLLELQKFSDRNLDVGPSSRWRNLLPAFVTFSDLTDKHSVRLVYPDSFDAVFGPGYKLRSITIEMTRDAVTRVIRQILPWLPHPTYFTRAGGCGPGDPAYCLHGGLFEGDQ